MGILETLGLRENGGGDPLTEPLRELVNAVHAGDLTIDLLTERIAELELSRDDSGWQRLGAFGEFDFTRTFLDQLVRTSRLMYLKNPLIKRSVDLQVLYVWAQGVTIAGKGAVGEIVTRFFDDPANIASFTGHQARKEMERDLQVEGNLFYRFFADPLTGRVKVRRLQMEQMRDILSNPEDAAETWFFKRSWTDEKFQQHDVLYPDWRYYPLSAADRPDVYEGVAVEWDTPVYHVAVNRLSTMKFGVPEMYAGLDWATAYKEFLENWHKIVKSLARWSWQAKTAGGKKAVDELKSKVNTTLSPTSPETNPSPQTGSVAVVGEGVDLTPIKTSGATVAAEDGRRLLLMVAATAGMPEVFYGDADVGNHATAKTLDRPTELKFVDRQTMWADIHCDVLRFAIENAAKSPGYSGMDTGGYDSLTNRLLLAKDPETGLPYDDTIDVDWPPILQRDPSEQVAGIVKAATFDGKEVTLLNDAKMLTRMLLTALGEDDVEDAVRRLYPEDGSEPDVVRVEGPTPPEPTPPPTGPPSVVVVPPAPADQPSPEERAAAERRAEHQATALAELRALTSKLADRPHDNPAVTEALTRVSEALATRQPVEVQTVIEEGAVVVNVPTQPSRKVTREATFVKDDSGTIVGKVETETEA